jgi:uncharacterized YigZ family protein
MMTPYKTLMKRGADEFIVSKSRFIGYGAPASNEAEAISFLNEIRAKHREANHNVYAYILGTNMGVMRYSDDGEPSGTAAMPVLDVLRARGVTDCAVVVTRYFGGVLLGAGGLVRAYTQGASIAVDACGVGTMYPTARYAMDVDYPLLGRVEYHLKSQPVEIEDKSFAEAVTLTVLVKCRDEQAFVDGVIAVTDGRVQPVRFEEMYRAWQT